MSKTKMTQVAASRIQSATASKGSVTKSSFAARAASVAAKGKK